MFEGAEERESRPPGEARLRAMASSMVRASHRETIGVVEELVRATRSLGREDRSRLQSAIEDAEAERDRAILFQASFFDEGQPRPINHR